MDFADVRGNNAQILLHINNEAVITIIVSQNNIKMQQKTKPGLFYIQFQRKNNIVERK